MMSFGCLTENVAWLFQGLRLLSSSSEKFHVDPAAQVHPISKTKCFWSTCGFSCTKLSRLRAKKIWGLSVWQRVQEKSFRIFSRSILNRGTKTSLLGMKILEESTWLFVNVCNGQKLVQRITVLIENIKTTGWIINFMQNQDGGSRFRIYSSAYFSKNFF